MSERADELDLAPGETVAPEGSLDEELVIDLARPLTWPGGMVEQLVISEPTAAQIRQWSRLESTDAEIKAVSVMTGLPTTVVEQLPARPFRKAVKRIVAFLA